MKPRVLFVSRRVELPLSPSLARKWDAIGAELDFRVLAGGSGGNGAFHLARELPALDGPAFFAALPLRIARELRDVQAARRSRAGSARDCSRAERAQARAHGHGRDRRPPRRLACADPPLRLAAARRVEPGRGPGRTRCASRSRRHPNGDRLHHRARARARPRARRRVSRLHGLRLLPPGAAEADPDASAGALRRRARALQERRRAGRSVAAGRAAHPGGTAAHRRHRNVATDRRAARSRSTRADELDATPDARAASRRRSTNRLCSSCRRGPREWAA